MKETKLSVSFRRLMADMKPMTWGQRVEHIWLNYKEHIFIGVFLCVLAIGAVSMVINSGVEQLINGVTVNMNISSDGRDYLTTVLLDKIGDPEKRQNIGLSFSTFTEMDSVQDVDKNYNETMGVISLVGAASLDYILMDEASMEFYIIQDIFCSLDSFLTSEELDSLEGKIIYAREESSREPVPTVIDITDMPFAKNCLKAAGKIYLAFSGNPTTQDSNRIVWDHMMAWEVKKYE